MPINPEQGHFFESGKVYSHSVGLSCCFRQWRAKHSHCSFLHGYAIKVELNFRRHSSYTSSEPVGLDDKNWVMDFGGLKEVKAYLERTFDHKTLVAKDDPDYMDFVFLHNKKMIQMETVEAVGCEAFAKMVFHDITKMLPDGVHLQHVRVWEHESNFAGYGRL